MALLSDKEARSATDSFLRSVYGEDVFLRWKALKKEMLFESERDYVCWLMDVAFHYKGGGDGFATDSGDDIANLTENDTTEDGGDVTYDGATEGFPDHTAAVKREASDMFHPGETKHKHKRRNESEFPSAEQDVTFEAEMSGAEFCDYGAAEAEGAAGASGEHAVGQDGEAAAGTMQIINYAQGNEDIKSGRAPLALESTDAPSETSVTFDGEQSLQPAPLEVELTNTEGMGAGQRFSYGRFKRFKCPYCLFSSDQKRNTQLHISAVHQRSKPFKCAHCDYSAAQESTLSGHLITKHEYSSKFTCQHCSKRFTRQVKLTTHLQVCPVMKKSAVFQPQIF